MPPADRTKTDDLTTLADALANAHGAATLAAALVARLRADGRAEAAAAVVAALTAELGRGDEVSSIDPVPADPHRGGGT